MAAAASGSAKLFGNSGVTSPATRRSGSIGGDRPEATASSSGRPSGRLRRRCGCGGGGAPPCATRPIPTLPQKGAPAELPRLSHAVLCGDFLSSVEEIAAVLRPHADRGVKGHLLRVLDPAEASLPFAGRVRFAGLEGEGELMFPRVESIREDYVQRFLAHEAA